jgi:hypothetical protein
MAKAGRPTRDPKGIAAKIFPVLLTAAEKDEYARAAKRAGISISEWLRDRLGKAAKREFKKS